MKYDPKNTRAWEQHWLKAPRTEFKSLNENEKTFLHKLNELLRQIEEKFHPIMVSKKYELDSRVDDPSDWLEDYELEFVITFYLGEDDPEYEEDDDNILIKMYEYVNGEDAKEYGWGFGATNVDHAEVRFNGEKHCYLYHHLYDHSYLDWRDLLRIGNLYAEVKVDEQSGMLPVRLESASPIAYD